MENKKIILVDDHIVVRNGLGELIEKLGPYTIWRQYDNGKQFVDDLSPGADLIVMDITMPEMDGDEVMDELNRLNVSTPVLILSLNENENKIIKLFRQGARGYLNKNCTATVMKQALEQIFKTGFYHNDLLAFALRSEERPPQKTKQEVILEKLSPKERIFLKHVCDAEEYTYDQIASLMNVQHRTVDGYREAIFDKFDIKSKSGLILFVLRNNLLDLL